MPKRVDELQFGPSGRTVGRKNIGVHPAIVFARVRKAMKIVGLEAFFAMPVWCKECVID